MAARQIKDQINRVLRKFGYKISRFEPGRDSLGDIQYFLEGEARPTIFDVGANKGQSVDRFKAAFPASIIHSFEPSPSTYAILTKHCQGLADVQAWNYGVGSQPGTLPLLENTDGEMTSFLEPGEFALEKGHVMQTTNVEVVTLDDFAAKHGIEFVHLLKVDTQGFEFEVFKGAQRLMRENKIALLYFEFNFTDMYKGQPALHTVFDFLSAHNFMLVTFYRQFYQKRLLSWTDLLFVNRDFYHRRAERNPNW
ncbi:MAG: FkbM family methyltransferase [Pirellulales bacterium]